MNDSPALDLLYQAALASEGEDVALLNAFAHPLLSAWKAKQPHMCLVQHFKPEIDRLEQDFVVSAALQGEYDLILLLPSKDKQQTLAWMAQAFAHLVDGGKLLMACENQYGAKSYESALKKVAGQVQARSKSKCRLFSALKTVDMDTDVQQLWLDAAKPQQPTSHGLWSQPGLFSWKTADVGSLLLLQVLPKQLSGVGMDLCCGYGLLAARILQQSTDIQHLHLVEADALALACAKLNTKGYAGLHAHHVDATQAPLPKKLDWVVCNPPFHHGQTRDVALGKSIVTRACHALKVGGEVFIVANRQLPYEAILKENLSTMDTLIAQDGFKVLHGKR